ncbi:ABC transporter substrate-binding protein [Paraburkholderia phenazinium]|uniref:Dipeptide transport system substrate-binding protein n=1 Tax=Paraburkholderia phenazinium TaxID=60549 RepID=A0A1N6EDD7_9BURK|nr:ABC transporter substrate-binding protein [Paraburkholderia phenazinium]SIN81062.1 dipeptide transport system substrate-binding protein [Paraburkholderia phenazinium]
MTVSSMLFAVRQYCLPALTTLAVATACFTPLTAPAASLPDKTLVFCSEGSPAGFDTAQYTTSVEFTAGSYTVYNRLVEFVQGGTDIEPGLAEKWDVSADGLQYTFHLRHGVKFQTTSFFKPTREFNADDVVFTFQRMLDPDQPFHKAYPVPFPYFSDLGLAKNVDKIEALDPYTVRFTLKTVDAPFLQQIAMPFASILSAEYTDQLLKAGKASDINLFPVGTGPFIFRSYTKDDTIRFDGNPDYWKPGIVKVSKLIFAITVDPAVRLQKLKRGECQVMAYPRPADIPVVKADSSLAMPSEVGFNLGILGYNTTKKPLDDVQVRRALDMSINKKAIIESVYQGAGQIATNPMPPTQWGYNKSLKDAPYDVDKAKALLKQAGYPDGFDLTLWAMPVQRPYNPNARLMAEMLQSDWAKIGVKVNIVTFEWGEYIRRAHAGEHQAILIGWTGDYGDPDNWLGVLLGCDSVKGSNFSKWCYKPFDDLITAARSTTDLSQRTKDYMEAQVIFKDQVPFTPIAHSTVYQPISKDVTGFKIDPFGPTQFLGVGLK